jgi:hypothetical protein
VIDDFNQYLQVTYDSSHTALGTSPLFDTPQKLLTFLQEADGIIYQEPSQRTTMQSL